MPTVHLQGGCLYGEHETGAGGGIRTPDLPLTRRLLYH